MVQDLEDQLVLPVHKALRGLRVRLAYLGLMGHPGQMEVLVILASQDFQGL